jgi:hypothetical protein
MRLALIVLSILRVAAALGLAVQSILMFAGDRTFKGLGGIGRLSYMEAKLFASSIAALSLALLLASYLDMRGDHADNGIRESRLRLASRVLIAIGFVLGAVVFFMHLS